MSLDAFAIAERQHRVIEGLESALFKIACGATGELVLSRGDMIDIAEEALPAGLANMVRDAYGRRAKRKSRTPTYTEHKDAKDARNRLDP